MSDREYEKQLGCLEYWQLSYNWLNFLLTLEFNYSEQGFFVLSFSEFYSAVPLLHCCFHTVIARYITPIFQVIFSILAFQRLASYFSRGTAVFSEASSTLAFEEWDNASSYCCLTPTV